MRHKTFIAASLAGIVALASLTSCNINAFADSDTVFGVSYNGKGKKITPSGKVKTVVRKLGKFNAVMASTPVRVVYSPNEMETKVVVSASDNVLEHVLTTVEKGCLVVSLGKVSISTNSNEPIATVYITGRDLTSFSATASSTIYVTHDMVASRKVEIATTSSGTVVAEKPIIAPEVEISATSSGIVKLVSLNVSTLALSATSSATVIVNRAAVAGPLAANATSSASVDIDKITAMALDAGVSSSGVIRLAGACPNTSYEASSSGNILAGDLKCTDCNAEASSGGTIVTNAINLNSRTSSSGKVSNVR